MITVRGSHGELIVHENGYVEEFIPTDPPSTDDHNYLNIVRFDFDEWKQYWGKTALDELIDILDLGYWYLSEEKNTAYQPPEDDWRTEIAEELLRRKREKYEGGDEV